MGNWILNLIHFLHFFYLSTFSAVKMRRYFVFTFCKGKMPKIGPKINKIEIWPNSGLKVIALWNKSPYVWTIKVVLELWFCHQKCHFYGLKDRHFWQNDCFRTTKKWQFWWQNQNSKTTFIVQRFPKYCRRDFYFMKLSLLSPILAKFQFCWFSGLFWAFFPCKKCKK